MAARNLTDAAGESMSVVDVGGYFVPVGIHGDTPEQVKQKFENIRHFNCRDDDVMLLSYPKTGTNWMNEVISMLLNKSTEKPVTSKAVTMLEFQNQETVDTVHSPRCLNTHVLYKHLPKDLKEKKLRTVLIVRNPKDTLVSYYNHVRGLRIYGYNGEWKDWFQLYLKGEMEYGMYTDYLKEFEKAIADGVGFPLHLLHYEDLKLNGLTEVKKLANFLGVDADEDLCQSVVEKCGFDAMAKRGIIPKALLEEFSKDGFHFLRKGQVGDWMNWFTVAQNEQFDKYWEQEMKDSKIQLTYAQS